MTAPDTVGSAGPANNINPMLAANAMGRLDWLWHSTAGNSKPANSVGDVVPHVRIAAAMAKVRPPMASGTTIAERSRCPLVVIESVGLSRQATTMTTGYSAMLVNARGATNVLKTPPNVPPTAIHK